MHAVPCMIACLRACMIVFARIHDCVFARMHDCVLARMHDCVFAHVHDCACSCVLARVVVGGVVFAHVRASAPLQMCARMLPEEVF